MLKSFLMATGTAGLILNALVIAAMIPNFGTPPYQMLLPLIPFSALSIIGLCLKDKSEK